MIPWQLYRFETANILISIIRRTHPGRGYWLIFDRFLGYEGDYELGINFRDQWFTFGSDSLMEIMLLTAVLKYILNNGHI